MFVCSVCKRNFRCLTSLKNHRKVHKTYYHVEYDTATSSNESMDNCSSDESEITYEQNNNPNLIFNIQDIENEACKTFNIQDITSEAPEFKSIVINNQQIAHNYDQIFEENSKFGHIIEGNSESNQMFENNILENDKISEEICSNDSELSDIDNAGFPNTAYRDFIDIVSITITFNNVPL